MIYIILQNISLVSLFSDFEKKFEEVSFQKTHILKSLLSFEQADNDPEPDYLSPINWNKVKTSIVKDVKSYLDTL